MHAEDYAQVLYKAAMKGKIGEGLYNIGGHNEKTNFKVANLIYEIMSELRSLTEWTYSDQDASTTLLSYKSLITYVSDHPEYQWVPVETFETRLRKTVAWYLKNVTGCQCVQDGNYQCQHLSLIESKLFDWGLA